MTSYHIAVCEDDQAARERLCGLCRSILAAWNVAGSLACFSSGEALRSALTETGTGIYDLFLLDIQMEGTSGLELAQWLYDQGVRDRVVFVTGSAEYALAGYSAHPLHYLLKPVRREALEEALRLAWELRRPPAVLFQQAGRTVSIPIADLRYLESRDHAVVAHMADTELEFYLSLSRAEQLLPSQTFSRCHKSYLVNLAWVKEIGRTSLYLRDGDRLPMSRTFYRAFQSDLVHWLNQAGR